MSDNFFTLEELGLRFDEGSHAARVRGDGDEFAREPCVLEINDLATLGELRSLWPDLLDKTPRSAFCQTFEWLQLYLQHFGDRQRLRVFCLDDAGETAGLIALVETATGSVRELTLPCVGGETFGPLGAHPAQQWRAVAEHLYAELTHNRRLDLRGLSDPQGQIAAALRSAAGNLESHVWTGTTALRLEGDFETFWSRVSSTLRSLVEAGEQKLATLGPTSFVRFRPQMTDRVDPRFPDKLYQDCLNVALNDEQQLPRADSVLNAPKRHLFLRDLLPWAWQHAAADLCLLLAGTRPIAFRFHTLACGSLRTVWTGKDAEFRQLPLAALLMHRTLRDSIQRGDRELDLGPTHPDVAREWHGTPMPLQRFVIGTSVASTTTQQPEETILYGD